MEEGLLGMKLVRRCAANNSRFLMEKSLKKDILPSNLILIDKKSKKYLFHEEGI